MKKSVAVERFEAVVFGLCIRPELKIAVRHR